MRYLLLYCALVPLTLACGRDAAGTDHGPSGGNTTSAALPRIDTSRAATPAPGVADEGPIMVGDHSVIRTEAVGPLRVGEWRRVVMSFVYAVSARAGRDSEDIIVVKGIGKDTLTLTLENDTLRRVFVTHTGPRTASGIGVGSPFDLVKQQPASKTVKYGAGEVTTVGALCGVEFATDSLALSFDSAAQRRARASPAVRAISIGYCKK
ncbi:MAG: hypothetical protein M3Z30_06015 [Gemmatimonadota bacterium]|nr:hypothetical protein [Gemmatimonadota bacterium]